ncbi:MAG: T9SS type A sorting domain-containing protein [bacterium]|nr:T9SS type A sorting domain-containing protein [bacterium]
MKKSVPFDLMQVLRAASFCFDLTHVLRAASFCGVVALCMYAQSTAQTYTHTQDRGLVQASVMGLTRGLSNPVIRSADGAMYIAITSEDNSYELKKIPHKWATQSMPNELGRMPYAEYIATAIAVSGDKVWVGSKDELSYQADAGWTKISTAAAGRHTQVDHLTAYEDLRGVFASISSTASSASQETQPRTTIELITSTDRRELYRDETAQFAFSSGTKLSDGSYLFASRSGNERCLVRVRAEGTVRTIAAPPGMPASAQPALVVKGNAGKYYCIYQAETQRSVTQPSFVVVYDEASDKTEYVELGNMGWRVTGGIMAGNVLLMSADNGVISLKDKKASTYRFFGNVEGIENDVEAMGITTLNRNTALVSTQLGFILLPLSLFDETPVSNEFTDLTAVSSKQGQLNFESLMPSDIIDWQVFDNSGRMITEGKTSVGEVPSGLNLPTLSSGAYNVVMTSAGNAVYLQRIIVSR